MRKRVGQAMIAFGVLTAVLTLGAYLYGLANPVESWEGRELSAYRYAQSTSGLTCTVSGVMLAILGGVVVRGDEES